MEIDIISKVISLKMKTLIFAVICISLHLDHHKEGHDSGRCCTIQNYSHCLTDEKDPNVIFMGIILYNV